MLNLLYGWYVNQYLGGRHINLVWRETLGAGGIGQLDLTDAVDGASIKADLTSDDLILYEVVTYASADTVAIDIRPDDDGSKKFTVDATQTFTRVPLIPPALAESDVILSYECGGVGTDFIMNISALEMSRSNIIRFTEISAGLAQMQYLNSNVVTVQEQEVEILKALANLIAATLGKDLPYVIDYGSAFTNVGGTLAAPTPKNFCRRKRS